MPHLLDKAGWRYLFAGVLTLAAVVVSTVAEAQGTTNATSYVTEQANARRFPLAAAGRAAPIVVSANDLPGVRRAATDLQADVARVTSMTPALGDAVPSGAREVVIVGTIGHSTLVDELVRTKKLDVRGIAGKWETFVIQVVDRPMAGVSRALVIAGSDRRGTIFGIYDVSEEIGVSPWYWFADAPVQTKRALYIEPTRYTEGEPVVKYRGIFLNDEAPALSNWARETFGGFNSQFYVKVYELILRLRGNFLWPAMWGNAIAQDDTLSDDLADEYGIVLSTSHHEPMTRAQAEWTRLGQSAGPWNYETNAERLQQFWAEGIRRMGTKEHYVTLAMRGDGDMPMSRDANIGLLERIVRDQRAIIARETGRPIEQTPQVWALYKEVQEYYDRGMRVPEDVTLLFADDNWGNIRRLPLAQDRGRAGGFGVYYHFDYVGGPRNYKWINTNPTPKTWEQMHLAWQAGATRIWVVNVGDLKPMEYPIDFFLDYAWNPAQWPATRLAEHARQWSQQQFGAVPAATAQIADVMSTYLKYAGRRKHEMWDITTYPIGAWNEAQRVQEEWDALERRAVALRADVPRAAHDAYYQLVEAPIVFSANLSRLYYAVARNRWYASPQQNRAVANLYADSAEYYFRRDAELTRHYHTEFAGGKWNHQMSQTHIGYTNWQQPPRNVMPYVVRIDVPAESELGVALDGQGPPPPPRPGQAGGFGGFFGGFRPQPPTLPEFDSYNRQTSYFDVFNGGSTPFEFTADASKPWVQLSQARGTVAGQTRVTVTVDWTQARMGRDTAVISVRGAGRTVAVRVFARNTPVTAGFAGFVQARGYVAMEANHFSRAVASAPFGWQELPDHGRTASAMMGTPVVDVSATPGGADGRSPRLEYDVFITAPDTFTLRAYVSPSLNTPGRPEGLRYAISIDGEAPQIVNIAADTSNRAWEQGVGNAILTFETKHVITTPGAHVVKYWHVDPGVVLQRLSLETPNLPQSYLGPPESYRIVAPATTSQRR